MSEIVTKTYRCDYEGCGLIWENTESIVVVSNNAENFVRHFCDHVHLTRFYAKKMGYVKDSNHR